MIVAWRARGWKTVLAVVTALTPAACSAKGSDGVPEALLADTPPTNAVWFDSLDLLGASYNYAGPQPRQSITFSPIRLQGTTFRHGVGTHAVFEAPVDLRGKAVRFVSAVGVDDARIGRGSVRFHVYVDGQERAITPVMHGGDTPRILSVDLRGAKVMTLLADDAGDGIDNDHADWAGAYIEMEPGTSIRPVIQRPDEPAPPIAMRVSAAPEIHGPRIVGATPGRPFLFRVPATGQAPLRFVATNLPSGLKINPRTGIISGALVTACVRDAMIEVRGPKGVARRKLRIVGGAGKLALTPPMGWNSWYVWYGAVDQDKVKAAAEQMVKTGLAAHGWQYVSIDDCWEGTRSAAGEIQTNERFPDMQALANAVHALGLRFGIYTSPGPKTCGNYEGSYQHEAQDVRTYARWGVDLVKYDWCSYGNIAKDSSLPEMKKPYELMGRLLRESDRDMVFSLCQYGMGDVWKWGAEVKGNLWRTTGDSGDEWNTVSNIGFAQAGLEKYAGPGCWNDPDMLMVGRLGGVPGHPTRMTRNEQITQVTLWSMIAAPLLLSCDLAQIDAWTLALLTNDEVLDIDQDPLGKAGGRVARQAQTEVWARKLYDGTLAVALFNRGPVGTAVSARWGDLGLRGKLPVRDLWLRKGLGVASGAFTAHVPAHGAVLVKIGLLKAH